MNTNPFLGPREQAHRTIRDGLENAQEAYVVLAINNLVTWLTTHHSAYLECARHQLDFAREASDGVQTAINLIFTPQERGDQA
ncbi:MAG: hypothetical protein HYV17_07905 [Xanthomonadales bacterium]|nr:hypothetical protein [Xanthomonadales bacterium]